MEAKAKKKIVCYCAFCRTPHRIYAKKGVGFFQVLVTLASSVCFMWGYWGRLNLQAIPIFLASLFLAEVFLHFRWRLALICRQCGFDPLIYQKSPERAAQKVKVFLEKRKSSPHFLLAPPIQLPKQRP